LQPLLAPTAEDFAFSRLISYAAYQWPGYRDAAHHRLIARHLEAVERGEIKRLMITMPPRHGKSMLASEFFPAWYLGRNPDHYVVTATYAQELADDFGRKVKNQIEDPTFQAIFPGVGLADDSKSAKRFHIEGQIGGYEHSTAQRGAFYAVGVGGPLTGRGAHLLLIDDPVKNREDADSEIIRKKTKDWYTSTAYTRLMPGGRVVIIQCMTGDTPVLMETGHEKPLRDIRPGDRVATYDNGKIAVSTVRNWINNGPDRVFAIRMKSGIIVKANARHPFLVEEGGERKWQRTATLKKGSVILRAIGGNGKVSPAPKLNATSQPNAKACACRTTTRADGTLALGHLLSTLAQGVKRICATAMGLASQSMNAFLPSRVEFAPSAGNRPQARTLVRTGATSSASIIATMGSMFAGFSATTATLRSDTGRLKQSSAPLLTTFEIVQDEVIEVVESGVEDVFDVQIDRTENFIANGLVSHNTRWHEDDLSGWLLQDHQHEGWVCLDLPAISDAGEALWPEQYDIESLEKIKLAIGPRDWSALYQQRPSPETGDYFKREWVHTVDSLPARDQMLIYGASDYAVTANGGDFTVHVVIGLDPDGRMYLLDLWRGQASSDVWVDAFCDLVLKWKPVGWAEETGQIKSGVGPFLVKRMMERAAYVARESFPTRGDKAIRAQSIRGRMAMNGLYVKKDAPFLVDLISEMMSFPVGVHDDQVDALGLVGQLLDRMSAGNRPKAAATKPVYQIEDGYALAPPLPGRRR
jgi:predicted phage terminase large subunit-like protein